MISAVLAVWLVLPGAAMAAPRSVELPPHRAASPSPASDHVEGQLLVRFEAGVGPAAVTDAHRRTGARPTRRFKAVPSLELVELPKGMSVADGIAAYETLPRVESVQPNYRYTLADMPNDPLFDTMWGLHNTGQTGGLDDVDIDAPEAWDVETGASDVIVAVADTGVDYRHPDLAPNLWINTGEIAGNGIDDDGNGFVDDIHGADTVDRDGDPMDLHGHGTHVSGTIGAAGDNGIGITGVSRDVSIMALRIFNEESKTTDAAILDAWAYAHEMGARVVNNSWGGVGALSPALDAAIGVYSDMLFVCAAGNGDYPVTGGIRDTVGDDNDLYPYYPASFTRPNILSVGAIDHTGQPTSFSNYGATSVDVYAPGARIRSTIPGLPTWAIDSSLFSVTLRSDQFDSLSGWTTSGTKQWVSQTQFYWSGSTAAGLLGYRNNENARLTASTPLDLADATWPWMHWKMGYVLEYGKDFVRWGVSDASSGVDHYLGSATGSPGAQFRDCTADLSEFIGQDDIYPFFELRSDGSNSSLSGYLGAWVDDFEVVDVQTPPAALRADSFGTSAGWVSAAESGSPWSWTNTTGFTAPGCWSLAPYSASSKSWLWTAAPIDLSGGIASVSFRASYGLAAPYDYVLVCASADDDSYYPVDELSGTSIGWERREADLSAFAGDNSVWLAFILMSDASVQSTGVRIDDLRVTESPWVRSVSYENAYEELSGTSMASPHVAGIAALLLARDSSLSVAAIKGAIIAGVDPGAYSAKPVLSGGRVNAFAALGGNHRPVADDDAYTTFAGQQLVEPAASGVLHGDSDADGPLGLTAVLEDSTSNGELDLSGDGSFTYNPDPGFIGTDTFTYRAFDGVDHSDVATVTITVREVPLATPAPVYRFYRPSTGTHFYTADEGEMRHVKETMQSTFSYEGVAYSVNTSNPDNSVPLWRFYNARSGTHLYTADVTERNAILANLSAIYSFDGAAYNVSTSGGLAVHRFYSPGKGVHFYSMDENEIAFVRANLGSTWTYEGPAYRVGQ